MDKREEILRLIEANSQLTSNEIAVMLDIPQDDVEQLIEELEKEKIIIGYHTVIDWDKTEDENVSAIIEVKVNPQSGQGFDRIAQKMMHFPEVEAMYLMAGAYDFHVRLKKAPVKDIARFVSSKLSIIEEVQSTSTHIILKKYKDHGSVFDDDSDERRLAVSP